MKRITVTTLLVLGCLLLINAALSWAGAPSVGIFSSIKCGYIVTNRMPQYYGAKADGTTDDSAAFAAAAAKTKVLDLGTYTYAVKDVVFTTPIYLKGNGGPGIDSGIGTTIKLASGGTWAFKWLGTSTSAINGGGLRQVRLDGQGAVANGLIRVEWGSHFVIEECGFNNVQGKAVSLQRVQESTIRNNLFRRCGANGGSVIHLDSVVAGNDPDNVNNLHIDGNTFGYNSGNWIGAAADSNLDALWINNNKFESDGTPASANSASTAVILLGEVARAWIKDNSFYGFSLANNKYDQLISLINGLGVVEVTGNNIGSFTGTWLASAGPTVYATRNYTWASTPTVNFTSTRAQFIEPPLVRTSNGNLSAALLSKYPKGFISAHQMWGSVDRSFVVDTGAMSYPQTVKSAAGSFQEIGRPEVSGFAGYPEGYKLALRVRAKAPSGDSALNLYLDATGLGAKTISAASGWVWVTWYVDLSSITNSSQLKLYVDNANTCYVDGYIIDITDAAQTDSVATDIAGMKNDFNALLAKLRRAGVLAQ